MSFEKDREYFDKHIKDTYGHTVEWNNGLPVAALDLMMWNIWQASANRGGYKLVPAEATDSQWAAGIDAYTQAMYGQDILSASAFFDIYKAMIGACDAQQEKTK